MIVFRSFEALRRLEAMISRIHAALIHSSLLYINFISLFKSVLFCKDITTLQEIFSDLLL